MRTFSVIMVLVFIFSSLVFLPAETIKVAVIKQIDITPFEDQVNGFIKGLEEAGYTKDKVMIEVVSVKGKIDAIKDTVVKLKNTGTKLFCTLGTGASLEALKFIKDVPVICSVTYAESLKENAEKFNYGNNYTATLMYVPPENLLNLVLKMKNIKRIGMIYNQSEDNARKDAANLTEACKTLGLKSITLPYGDENSIVTTFKKLIDSSALDCIIIPKDTLLVKHLADIRPIILQKKIIAVGYDEASVNEDVSVMAISSNNTDLGAALAEQAVEILKGKRPADIPIAPMKKYMVVVNLKVTKKIGINLPIEIIRAATKIIKE